MQLSQLEEKKWKEYAANANAVRNRTIQRTYT